MSDQLPASMSPGSMLDGRYRLEVLLSEHGGARFWRATDTVLARSVAVHVVASTDPRAATVLDAARTSARVTDPHFLRVLDCDDVDGITWVINEWGEGTSLDVMLAQGPLPPLRAAWLTREVAEAIAAAHAQGLHHGRLNPEAVLVTDSGAVKIIGFIVNAAFERTAPATAGAPYGVISDREADVIDLAGILYAALTLRWPGVAPSALAPAPREGLRPLRPRQVRAGIPRTLDAICDRVLNKEASQHVLPVETAHDIAAALSDYVGDPAAAAPVDVPSMHDDPEAPVTEVVPEFVPELLPEVVPELVPEEVPDAPVIPPVPASMLPPVTEPPANEPATPPPPPSLPEPELEPPPDPAVDPEATMAAPVPFSPSGIELIEPEEWEPAAPPPPFEAPVSKPLFAEVERRVPPGAPGTPSGAADQGSGLWPFAEEEPVAPAYRDEPRRRIWPSILITLLLIAAVAVGAYLLYEDQQGTDQRSPQANPTPTTSAAVPVTGTPVPVVAAGDFDPEGDPPEENPEQVPRTIDDDPATVWKTSVYTQPALGGLKSGVGIVLDLGSQREIGSIEVQVVGSPTDIEFFGTAAGLDAAPVELADARRLGAITTEGPTALFRVEPATTTRYVIVWLTRLPAVERGFQGQIAEITVRS